MAGNRVSRWRVRVPLGCWPTAGRASLALVASVCLMATLVVGFPQPAAAAGCIGNEIVCENELPGAPRSDWDIQGAGDDSIQGFATQMSVNRGETIDFKVKTDASAYTVQIFRLGYYQGNGARKIADVTPSAALPQTQPACATDPATEIFDCGTWSVSASWAVPSDAVSGVYIALLGRADLNQWSHIPFIVRNDSSSSDLVFQTSDTTWQAYNTYGGSSLYQGQGNGRAYKLSYNRPFATRAWQGGRDYLFSNEYPMIRFLESNGYDVSYISGLDTETRGNLLNNHKAFLSVGHDEYWTARQRSNVEAARDAGLNLAFFSGNEVYWKARWESSEDGSATPNRTLVCYKDTWANTRIDPSGPTSTWRDPRFGTAEPENSLTGTLYMANFTDLPVTVSAEEGKLRLWRNTPLADQDPGTSTELAPHTVGYESNEDVDNGYRPAGLIRMSTTVGPTPEYLQDFGNTVAPGSTTHHLTMYRASSGALVFSAGTVQWAWGLDTNHDGTVSPVSVPMQQATINILADMGAPATALSTPGVVTATRSTDTAAPSATITSPTATDSLAQGSSVTVTGTATDVGGGTVAGVEVSVDGGTSWHPAAGRESFSYTGLLIGNGSGAIQVRAIDDSGNIQSAPTVLGGSVDCPCSILGAAEPSTVDSADATPVTLGVRFTSSTDGYISGLRFYKSQDNTGTHVGSLYKDDGTVLATVTFANETASGWQTATFDHSVPIIAGATYVAAYRAPNGHYSADNEYFAYGPTHGGPLTAFGGFGNINGVYNTGIGMPAQSYRQTNYYVDVIYSARDVSPLTVVDKAPRDGSSSVPASTAISADFSRDVASDSITWTVMNPANVTVPGSSSYDAAERRSTFVPEAPLEPSTTYRASVTATSPDVGPMPAPASWTFTTASPDSVPGECPCGMFNDGDVPQVPTANDPNSVEVGMAFTADSPGSITGVRFYKGIGNAGPHAVSLWTSAGARLATASTAAETAAGWQTVAFGTPVSIATGETYLVSYRATSGGYSFTAGALASPRQVGPLRTPSNAGRYSYGSGAPLSISSSSYYVDPVFMTATNAAPAVSSLTPENGTTSVPTNTRVSATFSTAIQPGSAVISVTDSAGDHVEGTIGVGATDATAVFTPAAALSEGTDYQVTITGATNAAGEAMTEPFRAAFRTSGVNACPCSLLSATSKPAISDSGDSNALTVGLRFIPSVDGTISGLRFYRDASNTGVHTGKLYTATGTEVASLTFPTTDPGWQTASFSAPVAVTGGTTYVASVFMPDGHYSLAPQFFATSVVNGPLTGLQGTYGYGSNAFPNASYNNSHYYVDVSFTTAVPEAPAVTSVSPDGTFLAQTDSVVTAAFARAIDPSTLQFTVSAPSGQVPGTTTYDSATMTATFQPTERLATGTSFTGSVTASSVSGIAMASPRSWQFSTVAPSPVGDTYSLYSANDRPAISAYPDSGPVTVGARFVPSRSGAITAVKFFAGPGNNGPFDVAIWSVGSQTKIGSARVNGSAGGWMTVVLDAPVTIAAGTTYVASYRGSSGHYGLTGGGLTTGKSNGPLAIPAGGGAFSYADGFPGTSTGSEFFVDVVTVLDAEVTQPASPPAVTATSPDGRNLVQPDAVITASFDAGVDASSLQFSVSDGSGSPIAGATTYDSTTKTASLHPTQPLAFGTNFTASITADSNEGIAMNAPASWSFTTVAEPAQGTAHRLYDDTYVPATPAWSDTGPVTVGISFTAAQAGSLTAVRFYVGPGNTGPWTVDVWDAAGNRLGGGTAKGVGAAGWTTVLLDASVPLQAGSQYRAAYRGATGHYALTPGGLAGGRTNGPLAIPPSGGAYSYPSGAPVNATSADFAVDVTVVTP